MIRATGMAITANTMTLAAIESTPREARVATLSGNQRDAKLAQTRLVSGSVTLRFVFFADKSPKNPRLFAFTDRCQPGLVAAAFKPPRRGAFAGFGRLGESYVAARPRWANADSEAVRCIQLG